MAVKTWFMSVQGLTQGGVKTLKNLRPGVDLIGAIVTVDHGYRLAGGGGHHVDLGIDPGEGLLQHDHGKNRGAGSHVARPLGHGIGGRHAGTGMALGGRQRNPCLQGAGGSSSFAPSGVSRPAS